MNQQYIAVIVGKVLSLVTMLDAVSVYTEVQESESTKMVWEHLFLFVDLLMPHEPLLTSPLVYQELKEGSTNHHSPGRGVRG